MSRLLILQEVLDGWNSADGTANMYDTQKEMIIGLVIAYCNNVRTLNLRTHCSAMPFQPNN